MCSMFTNMRHITIHRPRPCLLVLGRDYHGSNRLFLGSNSPKPSHKYIPLDDPQSRERAAKIRSGKFANFPPATSDFSQLRKRLPTRRAPCDWMKFRKRDPEYAENPTATSHLGERNGVEKYLFFLRLYNFIQSNERRIFRGGEKRALEEDTSWSRNFAKVALICCTFPPNIRKSNEPQPTKPLVV